MRYRERFIVFPRTFDSGRTIYYFQTYDSSGRRTNPRSTGETSRAEANAWCMDQWYAGTLAESKKAPTLQEYTERWFIYERCPYIQAKLKRGGSFSKTNAANLRFWLKEYILPAFGKRRLDEITARAIEAWIDRLQKQTGHAASSINHYYGVLRIVLGEAERLGDLEANPCKRVKPLIERTPEKGILSRDEMHALFTPETWEGVWEGQRLHYAINRLAASCGLRLGECLGLRWTDVHDDYIHVAHSWEKVFKELKSTKTGEVRNVPISADLHRLLAEVRMENGTGDGFVFSLDFGATPVYDTTVRKWFTRAVVNSKLSPEDRTNREKRKAVETSFGTSRVTFHSYRHAFNTMLIESGLTGELVRELTGHKSKRMTELYAHVDGRSIEAVKSIQEAIG